MLKNFVQNRRLISILTRVWSGQNISGSNHSEQQLTQLLRKKFPKAENVNVTDVSGGCGAMFEIFVQSSEFAGISIIKQHRMITETLKDEIKDMHGLRIHTAVPKNSNS